MTALNWQMPVLALLLGIAIGGRSVWLWQANSYGRQLAEQSEGYQLEREATAAAVIEQMQEQQDQRLALEGRLQAQNKTHYQELIDEQTKQSRLRDRLATADVRLSVLLATTSEGSSCGVPAATGARGVVHGTTRAELDPAHAQRIIGITGDGDQGLIALKACQAYVRAVVP